MIDFFYDSLETLKTVKYPSKKDMMWFTAAVVWVLVIASVLFLWLDGVSSYLYRTLYDMFAAA